ncbi:TetR/AcrR family transcriptional regulator [Mycolicibacterium fluoranthenivorans]|uniref:AcrR family transcriptional regulator n=1 Tax=Mycolicibacterium fluoranthenivorans TaxID=258505 RepID=A0A7X5ZGF4_9MYCO|nr:TetR/AcrR family transcriptional regulator [Mycolicibacterium fluoranthenivorans]MCV7356407.1 TetR/AcrR family transcriptional regulator [Mycolicibacterium fluoranthenivorans]NIH99208.1 AcrR family transcriptional regulator [Mycolicibacterium fluoranthenivorans]
MARPNQTSRTRRDLLRAAARLMKAGHKFTLEDVAADAMVSRATAYRYFSSVEALMVEAPLDGVTPSPADLFETVASTDPVERLLLVDTALHDMIADNEPALRLMLSQTVQRACDDHHDDQEIPVRQNRRTALIEAALEPARGEFTPAALSTLAKSLSLIIGTESMVVTKDVLRLDASDARQVRHWAIRALVDSARRTEA